MISSRKIYVSILLILTGIFKVFSQNSYTDSLLKIYSKTDIDTEKVNILYKISKKSIYNNPEKAIEYSKTAYILSQKIHFKKGEALSLDIFGIYHQYRGEYKEADSLYRKSLKLRKEINKPLSVAVSYNNIGVLNRIKGDFKKSDKFLNKALRICEEQNDSVFSAKVYNNLGLLYENTGKYAKALEYHMLSLKIREKNGTKQSIASSLNNIGIIFISLEKYDKAYEYMERSLKLKKEIGNKRQIISAYMNMGNVKYYQKKYTEAINLYTNSLNISQTLNDKRSIAAILSNMAYIYEKKGDTRNAILFELESIEILKETGNIQQLCSSYLGLANLYYNSKNYKNAYKYAAIVKKTAEENNNAPDLKSALKILSDAEKAKGNYKQAILYLDKYITLKDSLFNEKNNKQILELQTKYETEKKNTKIIQLSEEKKISELKNQQFRLSVIILIIVLISSIIFALLWLKQSQIKSNQEAAELEQKLLRTQMNPHFIFNSISAIQDYILNNNPMEASGYLSDFAMLMRAILTSSSHSLIPLEKEIEVVRNYLKLQQMRLSDKFEYKINVSDNIDIEEIEVPPMLSQPFIENAVIHGIMNKQNGNGLINVSYFSDNNNLITEIKDNGIGRQNANHIKNPNHKSKAVAITEQRIKLIADKYKKNINFEIIDLKNSENLPSGTLVRFNFPI